MGDIFLQNYYSIYDFANNKVGLVESKGEQTGEGWSWDCKTDWFWPKTWYKLKTNYIYLRFTLKLKIYFFIS